MEKQYSVKFFTAFVDSLQSICQEHLTFDQVVEVSGYVSVEIDNARKERYVLSELLQGCGNVISESYCTKAFKNMPWQDKNKDTKSIPKENENAKETETKTFKPSCKEDKENTPGSAPRDLKVSEDLHKAKRSLSPVKSDCPGKTSKSNSSTPKVVLKRKSCDSSEAAVSQNSKRTNTIGGLGIESRSSSFLASSARPCSTHDAEPEETFQTFVTNVIDSLSSPTTSQQSISPESSIDHIDADTVSSLHKPSTSIHKSKKIQFSTQTPSQPHSTPKTTHVEKHSQKKQVALSDLFRLKPKPKNLPSLTSPERPQQQVEGPDQSLNISSLRHLVSKSYEDVDKLEQRVVGSDGDIPAGQAYIEVVEEGGEKDVGPGQTYMDVAEEKEDDDEDDEDGDIISLDGMDTEAEESSSPVEKSVSVPGWEMPCLVSSTSLAEVPRSTLVSASDVESSPLVESEQDDLENLDSPIVIDLDSSEEDSGVERENITSSLVEIRKLDTFKDYVKSTVKRFQEFTRLKGINEPIFQISPKKLDSLLAEFYLTVKKKSGSEFGVSSLKSIQSYIELYLRENGYPASITKGEEFKNCRTALQAKIQHLRDTQIEIPPIRPGLTVSLGAHETPLTRRDVDKLFKMAQLGGISAHSITNSMWFMNTVLFKVSSTSAHCSLRWNNYLIQVDEYQNEFLQLWPNSLGRPQPEKVYPNNADPERCFVRMFKMFERMRPTSMLGGMSPFYLAVNKERNVLKNEEMSPITVTNLFRNMLLHAGIQSAKKICDFDVL